MNYCLLPEGEHKLYSDEIPLRSEDLYGPYDYEYYSYKKDVDSTSLQDTLPAKDSPPRIEYEILEPHFDFTYRLSKEHLLTIPEWWEPMNMKPLDNSMFGTVDAYQSYYDDTPSGEYTLFFEDRIIILKLEEPLTTNQISVIKSKLNI